MWARQRCPLCIARDSPARSVLGGFGFQAAEPGASVPRTLREALDGQRLWGLAWRAGTRQSSGPERGLSSLPRISLRYHCLKRLLPVLHRQTVRVSFAVFRFLCKVHRAMHGCTCEFLSG